MRLDLEVWDSGEVDKFLSPDDKLLIYRHLEKIKNYLKDNPLKYHSILLKNITINDRYISCDYFPEGKDFKGTVRMNIDDSDDYKIIKSELDKDDDSYSYEVLEYFEEILGSDEEIPDHIQFKFY